VKTLRRQFASARAALLAASLAASLFAARAQANTLSAIGGLGFGRNTGMNDLKSPRPLLGAEYMLDFGPALQLGGSYLENFLSYNSGESGSIRAAGLSGRIHFLGLRIGPFADALVGLARRTQGQNSSGNKLSYGGGVGFEFPLAHRFSMSPHVGVRMLPDSISDAVNRPVVDGSLMFSIRL
jgi:hypothetical protein